MIDGGLPNRTLLHVLDDRTISYGGSTCLAESDFASSTDQKVAVAYDPRASLWHSDQKRFRRDRQKRAALQEVGWVVVSIVVDDVRQRPWDMLRRIEVELRRQRAA